MVQGRVSPRWCPCGAGIENSRAAAPWWKVGGASVWPGGSEAVGRGVPGGWGTSLGRGFDRHSMHLLESRQHTAGSKKQLALPGRGLAWGRGQLALTPALPCLTRWRWRRQLRGRSRPWESWEHNSQWPPGGSTAQAAGSFHCVCLRSS